MRTESRQSYSWIFQLHSFSTIIAIFRALAAALELRSEGEHDPHSLVLCSPTDSLRGGLGDAYDSCEEEKNRFISELESTCPLSSDNVITSAVSNFST